MYIPKTIAEVSDLLKYMVIYGPSFTSYAVPENDIDAVFSQLDQELTNSARMIGESARDKLHACSATAKDLYEREENRQASFLLQHMVEYIRLRKLKTDESVVDESRFER